MKQNWYLYSTIKITTHEKRLSNDNLQYIKGGGK